jgi:hypothetical protein
MVVNEVHPLWVKYECSWMNYFNVDVNDGDANNDVGHHVDDYVRSVIHDINIFVSSDKFHEKWPWACLDTFGGNIIRTFKS